MRIQRLPLDPTELLLDALAGIIRAGVPGCSSITGPTHVPWVAGQTSPAGHYLVPAAGWHLFLDREPVKVTTPALILTAPVEGKEKLEYLDSLWALSILVRGLVPRDSDVPALEAVIARLQIVLTETLTLDDTTRQTAQARLSSPALHLEGLRRADNFLQTATGKIESFEGHPEARLAFTAVCCRRAP